MSEYTFSYHVKVKTPSLQRRKWWDIFGSDKIVFNDNCNLRVVSGLNEHEKDVIVRNINLIQRIVSTTGEVFQPQLEVEETPFSTSYIKTSGEQRG